MAEIRVPKLNNNDLVYTLTEWLVAEGVRVRAGDPVVVLETSKAAEELDCEDEGYLHRLVPDGAECAVGEVIGQLLPAPVPAPSPVPPPSPAVPVVPVVPAAGGPAGAAGAAGGSGTGPAGIIVTDPARRLIRELGLDEDRIAGLGRRVVRREDVLTLVDGLDARPEPPPAPPRKRVELSRSQRAVAAVVTESHRTVPPAFVAVAVDVDAATALARRLTRRHRGLVGLPELLVKAVASLGPRFPACFATLQDDGSLLLAEDVDVGITMDVGGGLVVPVIRRPAGLDWHDLATTVMERRLEVMSGKVRARDVAGAHVVIALHNDPGVTVAVPIVFPGQVCAVSLGGVRAEVRLGPDAELSSVATVQLGLAYDHRVINGRDAVLFLQALKTLLESPDDLERLGAGERGTPDPG